MPKIDEVWLMFCWHAEQLQTVEELKQREKRKIEKENWARKYVTAVGKINDPISNKGIYCNCQSRARVCVKRNICT